MLQYLLTYYEKSRNEIFSNNIPRLKENKTEISLWNIFNHSKYYDIHDDIYDYQLHISY